MVKKFFAVLLALLMCMCVFGCSKDGAPDGMYLASMEGEPFKLYVPDAWTSNTSSGISGAFFSAADNIAVSARFASPANAEVTLEDYVKQLEASYAKTLSGYAYRQTEDSVIGGKDADMLRYVMVSNSVEYTFCEYVVQHDGGFVSLVFRCPTTSYDTHAPTFTKIKDAFVLSERTAVTVEAVTDKKTPEGMKIASSDVVEYRMYVPNAWVCNPADGRSDAYLDIVGRPNVSVTSFSPDKAMTAEEYFANAEIEYKKSIAGYELLSTGERQVAERAAKVYTYRAAYGETSMRIMQVIFVYNQMVYSYTYTATDADFDTYVSDVNSMLDAFRFR